MNLIVGLPVCEDWSGWYRHTRTMRDRSGGHIGRCLWRTYMCRRILTLMYLLYLYFGSIWLSERASVNPWLAWFILLTIMPPRLLFILAFKLLERPSTTWIELMPHAHISYLLSTFHEYMPWKEKCGVPSMNRGAEGCISSDTEWVLKDASPMDVAFRLYQLAHWACPPLNLVSYIPAILPHWEVRHTLKMWTWLPGAIRIDINSSHKMTWFSYQWYNWHAIS